MIDESCSAADIRGIKGRRELEQTLVGSRKWCNGNPTEQSDSIVDDNVSTGRQKATVPMTQTKYTGAKDCGFNTYKVG